jgi:hypothetical protein
VEDWLGEVDRHVADLHLTWSSPAATAQQGAYDKWISGVSEMRETWTNCARSPGKRAKLQCRNKNQHRHVALMAPFDGGGKPSPSIQLSGDTNQGPMWICEAHVRGLARCRSLRRSVRIAL